MPRCSASHAAADTWMSATDLLQLFMAAKQQAEQVYEKEGASLAACRQLHDAALSCTMFGYLPPMRLTCIRTMTHPSYTGPCLNPDCHKPGCRGNRLIVHSTQPLQLEINIQHHKTERGKAFKPITFTVPAELAQLLHQYAGQPHSILTQAAAHVLEDAGCPYLFMTKSGQMFGDSQLCTYWNAWLVAHGGTPMPPSKLRHIFVGERRSDDAAPGPSDAAAARVMGHSEIQWSMWYDVHRHKRQCQHGVDAMAVWRQHLLQAATSRSAASELPIDVDVSADEVSDVDDEDIIILL